MPVVALAPELVLVVGGLVAAILGISIYALFRPLLSAALGGIPYAGPWIAQHVEELLATMVGAAALGVDAAIGPLADLFRRALAVLDTLTRYTVGTIDNVFNRMWALVHQDLPALEQRADAYSEQLARIAIAHADQAVQAAIGRADQEFEAAIHHTDQVGQVAIQRADQDARQAIAYAQQLAQTALDQVQATAQTLAQALDQEAGTQARYTDQVAQTVLEYVQAVQHDLGMELEQVGAQDQEYARALERIAVDHADQVGAAVAAATAAATAEVVARVQDLEHSPCQQRCGVLGELGDLLQGLEDAGLTALLLAVLDEVEHDPQAVQQVLRKDVVPIFKDALGALV